MAGSEFVEGLYTLSPQQLPEIERECDLCQIPYESITGRGREVPIRLPCGHTFGDQCIYQYMSEEHNNNNKCPSCGTVSYNKLYRYVTLGDLIDDEGTGQENVTAGDFIENEDYEELVNRHKAADQEDVHEDSPSESEVNKALEYEEKLAREFEENQRWEIAVARRIGSLADRATYQELLADTTDLPPLAATDVLLNLEQDRALFEELQRRGAFSENMISMRQFKDHSDFEVYEIFRDKGLRWSTEHGKWVRN